MPMAGAPRTRSWRIASHTLSTSRHSTNFNSNGNSVWSMSLRQPSAPPIHSRVARVVVVAEGFILDGSRALNFKPFAASQAERFGHGLVGDFAAHDVHAAGQGLELGGGTLDA